MTRQEMYAQCRLTRGAAATVGFIPTKAAVIGNLIELVINGNYQPGWRVESVGTPVAKDAMRMFERQYTSQRQGSDN
ncbi:hypothetical protein [Algisphaera agarilytica]|uniref:Uncharacterized protein n=1 Tax=Algisphaera agarilytica TaxID=1385975 RepID=A0A7X0H610_9BACT|nr:hypothetical protein [Algisphaera agarilytica]MBB6429905.1 hypothetical protein [Algisphaera agarilytica]